MKKWNKIVIAGGSGFLGESLTGYLKPLTGEIVILTRGKETVNDGVRYVHWDGKTAGAWTEELEGADVVLNMCGKSVDCRYTAKNKALIFSSRLEPTAALGKAIAAAKQAPGLWINAASATIYRHSEAGDLQMTETGGEIGEGFSVEVCKAWEKTFYSFETPGTRKVNLRIGMVLGNAGGVFPTLCKMTKLGLGGRMGNGKQLMSWMHVTDFCEMVSWCITHAEVQGTYNCTAPEPVSNADFMKWLRTRLHVAVGLPASTWMLAFGAFFIRTEPELVLKSRNAIPQKAMEQGFRFAFPDALGCIENLLQKK
ncbi:MAG: TIGR01777 family oxidoreductase [Bacteroidetes bacterium]|nr:TIGR01777 family oxidoreductase [Bacteroidota bacterium]